MASRTTWHGQGEGTHGDTHGDTQRTEAGAATELDARERAALAHLVRARVRVTEPLRVTEENERPRDKGGGVASCGAPKPALPRLADYPLL